MIRLNSLPSMFANSMFPGARPMVEAGDGDPGRSLQDAAATVQTYLQQSPSLSGTRIVCEVAGDRIVLRGYVSTYSMKQTARVLAESVAGDNRIEDRLDVIPYPPKWPRHPQPNSNGL